MKNDKKILLLMAPFWDPICPPQGMVCLKSYLQQQGYNVYIEDFNTDANLISLQNKYFSCCLFYFPHWKYLIIYRNGPRYFSRHQLVFFYNLQRHNAAYRKLVECILNFGDHSICSSELIEALDAIIDESINLVLAKIEKLLHQLQPEIVGCTMLESTLPLSLSILQKVKEINPRIKTVLGGPGAVVGNVPEDGNLQNIIQACPWLDAILYGEGEKLFLHYIEGVWENKKIISIPDLKSLPGKSDNEDLLLNVDSIPMPDYGTLSVSRYLWLSIFTSRGCPFHCTFCFENCYWIRFRQKKLEKIIDEIKTVAAQYKKDKFYFCDSLCNPIVTALSQALLKEEKKYSWDCYLRVTNDCLDAEKVKLWAAAGLERVRIGVESASLRVLGLMNKDITTQKTKKAIINFAQNKVQTSTLWIAGFPGESEMDFEESINFLKENGKYIYQADIWEFISSPREIVASENKNFQTQLLYPKEFNDLLILKYYDLVHGPSSIERFDRVRRFEETRMQLGIPNPYSLLEMMEAQERWGNLGYNKDGASF